MRYNKNAQDGYILAIGTGAGCEEITEQEYNAIKAVIDARPTPTEGYGYRLKTDLTWERYELPEPETTDEDVPTETVLAELQEVLE